MTDDSGTPKDGVERRKFLKGAATVAWATPLVLTMGAGQAGAQTASTAPCIAIGMHCNACQGMPCCDVSGPQDGGCCCSPKELPQCDGICVADDASCQAIAVGDLLGAQCYVPAP